MILTVTPNPCVDKTYRIDGFSLNRLNRPNEVLTVAGGKGLNVARVFEHLGGRAFVTGFLGGPQGQIVFKALEGERIAHDFVQIKGETRLCIKVVDPSQHTETEINELGPVVEKPEGSRLLQSVERLLKGQRFSYGVFCGSLPLGLDPTFMAELIEIAKKQGVRTVLDSNGPGLKEGIKAVPWMVKPNRIELGELCARPINTLADAYEAAQKVMTKWPIEVLVCTLGNEGAIWVTLEDAWHVRAPKVEVLSAVASGDSFLAGLLFKLERNSDVKEALKWAAGAGAANAEVLGAGFCSYEAIANRAQEAYCTRFKG